MTLRVSPQVLAAIQARDPDALEAAVRENAPILLRAARAAGLDADAAEEATQETLLVFVEKAHTYDGRAAIRTWLFGILFNKIAEQRRLTRREEATDAIDDVVDARFDAAGNWLRPPRAPDADAAAEQVGRWLDACLALLSERRRSAFVLREVEGLPPDEICKILDVSRNNLGVLLFRARNALRECLETKGIHGRSDVAL